MTRVHGDVQGRARSAWDEVYALVRRIPHGRVMNYGQIAECLNSRLSARAVGWAMSTAPPDVPWQRVVSAAGVCSTDRRGDMPPGYQRALLEEEGVVFSHRGALDMTRYRWWPPGFSSGDDDAKR